MPYVLIVLLYIKLDAVLGDTDGLQFDQIWLSLEACISWSYPEELESAMRSSTISSSVVEVLG